MNRAYVSPGTFVLGGAMALAILVVVTLTGCDTYGIDPLPAPPTQNPPPGGNPGGIDTAALAAALGCPEVLLAQVDGSVAGTLTDGDCTLPAGRFPLHDGGERLDAWAFELADSTALRLDMEALGFDAVLALLNADMDLVAFNDDRIPGDPAPDENATIDTTLAGGIYVAITTSFFEHERGSYRLTITTE